MACARIAWQSTSQRAPESPPSNLIGNGVASVAVSKWEGELDMEKARAALHGAAPAERQREPALAPAPADALV
jgi:hypothetical protein